MSWASFRDVISFCVYGCVIDDLFSVYLYIIFVVMLWVVSNIYLSYYVCGYVMGDLFSAYLSRKWYVVFGGIIYVNLCLAYCPRCIGVVY